MVKLKKILNFKSSIASLFIVGVFSLLPMKALAITASSTINQPGNCGSANEPKLLAFIEQPISGELYIRLPQNIEAQKVTLYSQELSTGSCSLIGAINDANSTVWTPAGTVSSLNSSDVLVAQVETPNLQAYTAALDILSLASPAVCTVQQTCQTSYEGYSGSLEPKLVSQNTSQIAQYIAYPIDNIKYFNVNYYADGVFLYSSKKLSPINHNYLTGGMHSVVIQVNLVNNEKFLISQAVNMGTDWSGTLFIRSTLYRTHNQVLFFVIIAAIIILLLALLWGIRFIYKRYLFKVEHGLTHTAIKKLGLNDSADNEETKLKKF